MLLVATPFKLLAEIALLATAGQWVLGRLTGDGKHTNPFCRVQLVGKPWRASARGNSPPWHLPLVAVLLAAYLWLVATAGQLIICLTVGMALYR
jgi:hypothetical protein